MPLNWKTGHPTLLNVHHTYLENSILKVVIIAHCKIYYLKTGSLDNASSLA